MTSAALAALTLLLLAAPVTAPAPSGTLHAKGTFDVKLTPQGESDRRDGAATARMTADKQYHGDLEGTGQGEMLSALADVKGSGSYVAIERVSGTLHGRKGTFVLDHRGRMTRGAQQLEINVVPDSGTGEIAGLTGRMGITITEGRHDYDFEYVLSEAKR